MPTTYRARFHGTTRTTLSLRRAVQAAVEITVPDSTDPLEHIANEIARELELLRYEVQIGAEGGQIRLLGDDGPGIAFSLDLIDQKDS